MIVRFKLVGGGKINLVATSVSSFTENTDGSSTVTMTNGDTHEVAESAQSVRGAFKRLNKTDDSAEG